MISKGVLFEDFAGREEELSLLVDLRERAARLSKPSCVTITGEAGIGKSRLIKEFSSRTARMRGAVLEVPCDSIVPTPYAAVLMLLESAKASARGFEPVDSAYSLLADIQSGDEPLDGDRESRLHHGVITALQLYAVRRGHLVIVLEDAHECDSVSLAFFATLVKRSGHSPLLFITTARNYLNAETSGRLQALARVERTAEYRIVLEPLPEASIVRAIAAALPKTSSSTARDLAKRSEGNPFFAEELARLSRDGTNSKTATLRSATAGRFAVLTGEQRAIVQAAAVIGREFELSLLYEIVAADEIAVDGALRACHEAGLIVTGPKSSSSFGHALLREYLEESMPRHEALRLHEKIADAIEAAEMRRGDIFALAWHRWKSENQAGTIFWNERAGDSAASANAHYEAAECYRRVLNFVDPQSDSYVRIAPKAAHSYATIGQFAIASHIADDVMARLETQGNIGEGLAIATKAIAWSINAGEHVAAERFVKRARGFAARSEDPAKRTELEILIALLAFYEARGEPTLDVLVRLEESVKLCEPAIALRYRNARAIAYFSAGDTRAALADLQNAIDLAGREHILRSELTLIHNFCAMEVEIGNARAVIVRLRSALERAMETDLPYARALLALTTMRASISLGNLKDAAEVANVAIDLDTPFPQLRAEILATSASLAMMIENDGLAARASIDEAIDIAASTLAPVCMCNVASTIARAHLSSDRKAAKRYLELAWIDGAFASCNSAITDVVSIVGNPEQVAFAKASLEANARDPAKLAARARFDIFQAAVAAGRHASLECRELADRAAAGFRELGMPIDEAWSLECGSRTNLAAAVYERIGAKAEARRLTGAVAPADVEVSASLTSREEQVCRLIASGLTNREAAARLSIGARTTETHLANAYRKLGLRSRAELAARFGR